MIYPCDEGYIEINNLCFFEDDINLLQQTIDNSYQSGIDLGCEESMQNQIGDCATSNTCEGKYFVTHTLLKFRLGSLCE